MKKKSKFIILAIFCLLSLATVTFGGDLNAFYMDDYDGFWKHWNKIRNEAVSCTDRQKTSIFFSNALETLGNAEVSESNSKEIEKIAIERPECLLQGLSGLIPENQNKFISYFLINPIYNNAVLIEKSLLQVWKKAEYMDLKSAYYRIKGTS